MISLHTAILRFFIYLNTIMKTDSFLAQRLACRAHNPKVGGSNPAPATKRNPFNRRDIKGFLFLDLICEVLINSIN